MSLLFDHSSRVKEFVGLQLDIKNFGPSSAIGILRDGKLVGGAVYNNFRWPTIQISVAASSPKWASKEMIRAILRYPFVQLDCSRISAVCKETNYRIREFNARTGFIQEGYHPLVYPDGTASLSWGLLRKNCWWLSEEERNGTRESTPEDKIGAPEPIEYDVVS